MRYYKTFILVVLFGLISFLSVRIYKIENERRRMKEDLIELSKVKYGLFNVDEWKKILSGIISKKVEQLNFTGSQREEMRKKISAFLYAAIEDFEKRFHKKNSGSIGGLFKSALANSMGAFTDVKKDVPNITNQILEFLESPDNRKALKEYIIEKLNDYSNDTFAKLDYSTHDAVLAAYNYSTREAAINGLNENIEKLDKESLPYKIGVLVLALLSILWVFVAGNFSKLDYLLLVLLSLAMLITGLLLPMIEIDARIASMTFKMLGEEIAFSDQVLYFKSKSIIEVVQLMLQQSRTDVLIVGLLVLVFSVLFPVSKLFASLVYVNIESVRSNKLVRFLVFKTGKWSMADVMVIAIFMAYIGFSGIITEQLKQIEAITNSIEILTTNKSNLLTGFFFFTSFAIFSLAVSQKMEVQHPAAPPAQTH